MHRGQEQEQSRNSAGFEIGLGCLESLRQTWCRWCDKPWLRSQRSGDQSTLCIALWDYSQGKFLYYVAVVGFCSMHAPCCSAASAKQSHLDKFPRWKPEYWASGDGGLPWFLPSEKTKQNVTIAFSEDWLFWLSDKKFTYQSPLDCNFLFLETHLLHTCRDPQRKRPNYLALVLPWHNLGQAALSFKLNFVACKIWLVPRRLSLILGLLFRIPMFLPLGSMRSPFTPVMGLSPLACHHWHPCWCILFALFMVHFENSVCCMRMKEKQVNNR